VNGSIAGLAALRFGIEQARVTDRTLHAVLAWCPPGGELSPGSGTPALVELWTRIATERLQTAFEQAAGGVPPDVDVRLHVRRGEPGPVLIGFADRSTDLLVIGAGRGGGWPFGAGGVRRYCLRHSRCPLVLAPPPEMAAPLVGLSLAARLRPLQPGRGAAWRPAR
jgi:nucleotide-binding universal stress UspA family protein